MEGTEHVRSLPTWRWKERAAAGLTNGCPVGAEDLGSHHSPRLVFSALKGRHRSSPGQRIGLAVGRLRLLAFLVTVAVPCTAHAHHPSAHTLAVIQAASTAPASGPSCAANVPHVTGTWVTLPYLMPVNPVSATLLQTGQILIIAGSENDASNYSPGSESYRAAVWDPTGTTGSSIAVQEVNYDIFCSGTAVLPDGRALVVGGTNTYSTSLTSFTGDNRS